MVTVSIIGVGARGGEAYGKYINECKDKYDIVALCDLNPGKLEKYSAEFNVGRENCFLSEEEFFKEWFLQKFNSDIISKSDYLFTVLLNNVDTDITQFDYLSCKKPLKYLLESEKINFSLKKYKKTGA